MSASARIIEKAHKSVTVEDATGRKIVMRKPSRFEFGEFLAVLGSKAENGTYLSWVLPLSFVRQIGDEVPPPIDSLDSIRQIFDDLGDEGHDAVLKGVLEHFPSFLSASSPPVEDLKKK